MFGKYDFNKIKQGSNICVKDLITELEKLNPMAKINICGDSQIYINVADDESIVSLDYNVESDWYFDKDGNGFFGGHENIPTIQPIIFNNIENENLLFNIIGIDDLEGETFGRFTSQEKAEKAKEIIESNGFEDVLDIVKDHIPVDTVMIDRKLIKL